jgi:hypothetical protein
MQQHTYAIGDELYWSGPFTMDHYPPASVGGKKKALVCKPCNDSFGKNLDCHLPNGLRASHFFNRKGSMPIRLSVNNGKSRYRVEGKWNDEQLQFLESNKHSNLGNVMKAAAVSQATSGAEYTLHMSGTFPKEFFVHRALLKAGYLQFFTWAGFDFAFSKTAHHIRNVLKGTEEHPLRNQAVFTNVTGADLKDGIYALTNKQYPRIFFTHLTFTDPHTKEKSHNIILIPTHTRTSWDEQVVFESFLKNTEIEFSFLGYHDRIMPPGKHFRYSDQTRYLFAL